MYLCGDETSAAAAEGDEDDDDDEDQDGTVSARSFETACATTMTTQDQAQAPVADHHGHVNGDVQLGGQGAMVLPTEPAAGEEEAAATLIQSAFRGLMARRRQLLPELEGSLSGQDGCCAEEPCKSPASPSTMAASVEVQVGESLSNLRLSDADDGASLSAQHRGGASQTKSSRPQVFRAKEEWDDSTLSSNMLRMRIQSKMEATTRRERALAYAFSQQLRSCGGTGGVGGTKKRSSRSEQGEFNVGWSWLERWMATRRVVVVRRRPQGQGQGDVAVEEKESCGSNDVSAVSFDGSSAGGRSGLSCYRPGKNRLRGARNLPRRKVAAAAEHRLKERSHKVSKKARQREDRQAEADEADDPRQPPTDY